MAQALPSGVGGSTDNAKHRVPFLLGRTGEAHCTGLAVPELNRGGARISLASGVGGRHRGRRISTVPLRASCPAWKWQRAEVKERSVSSWRGREVLNCPGPPRLCEGVWVGPGPLR